MAKMPTKPSKPSILGSSTAKLAKNATSLAKTTSRTKFSPAAAPTGASVAEIVEATEVAASFCSRLHERRPGEERLQLDVVSEKDAETGERRYYVAAIKAQHGRRKIHRRTTSATATG